MRISASARRSSVSVTASPSSDTRPLQARAPAYAASRRRESRDGGFYRTDRNATPDRRWLRRSACPPDLSY
ncbi:hypothetical protein [Paraburkholderia azotifigens]|uniref:hypothetical protein n=1 Tax=Paraburkholderia azotifigens TaxID=2057004 RepID=UPI003CCC4853